MCLFQPRVPPRIAHRGSWTLPLLGLLVSVQLLRLFLGLRPRQRAGGPARCPGERPATGTRDVLLTTCLGLWVLRRRPGCHSHPGTSRGRSDAPPQPPSRERAQVLLKCTEGSLLGGPGLCRGRSARRGLEDGRGAHWLCRPGCGESCPCCVWLWAVVTWRPSSPGLPTSVLSVPGQSCTSDPPHPGRPMTLCPATNAPLPSCWLPAGCSGRRTRAVCQGLRCRQGSGSVAVRAGAGPGRCAQTRQEATGLSIYM